MVRDISSATEAEANEESNIPTELYQVFLPDTTLYLIVWPNALDFYDENGNAQTYQPAAISRRPIKHSKGMDVDRLEIQLDNVGQEWSGYAANYDLSGVKVTIWGVFLEQVGGTYQVKSDYADRINKFSGQITSPQIDEQQIRVQVKSNLDTLDKRLPGRTFATKCQWAFGSDECGVTPPTNSGTIQAMDVSQTAIFLESMTDTNWTYGSFETGDYMRAIEDYSLSADTVILEFPLPAEVEVGDTYKITAGCSKVKNDKEKGCQYWENQLGNNQRQYFGGFPKLPKYQDIRQ